MSHKVANNNNNKFRSLHSESQALVFKENSKYQQQMKNSKLSIKTKMQMMQENSLDPLQVNELIVEQKLFLPLKISETEEANVYPIIFKIMRAKHIDKILIYILSEADLYFLYRVQVSNENIMDLNNLYKLSLKKLSDFVQFIKGSLDDIQSQQKIGILQIINKGEMQFILKRMVGGKTHTVMKLLGKQQSEETIKVQVAFRYGMLRQKIQKKQERIDQLRQLVRLKNPYLLQNFKQI